MCFARSTSRSSQRSSALRDHRPRPIYLTPIACSVGCCSCVICYDTRETEQVFSTVTHFLTMTHNGTFVVERTPEEVFAVLAVPDSFAPLLPDFASMAM